MLYNLMKDYLQEQLNHHNESRAKLAFTDMKEERKYHALKSNTFYEALRELEIIQEALNKLEAK